MQTFKCFKYIIKYKCRGTLPRHLTSSEFNNVKLVTGKETFGLAIVKLVPTATELPLSSGNGDGYLLSDFAKIFLNSK